MSIQSTSVPITRPVVLALVLALITTALIYTPGLQGIFIFDDGPNILENDRLTTALGTAEGALRAAFSSPAGGLSRPVSMVSFWANIRLSGVDAFDFKLTNLLIHL